MKIRFGRFFTLLIIYFSVAFAGTLFLSKTPMMKGVENVFFDKLQKKQTIDSKDDPNYFKYSPLLSKLVFVNFDEQSMNHATDRVKKYYIHLLLDKLMQNKQDFKMAFLDYDLSYLTQNDSLILPALLQMEQQLVTPRLLFAGKVPVLIKNPLADSLIHETSNKSGLANFQAFAVAWKENISYSYRFFLYRIFTSKLKTYNSVPYVMAQRTSSRTNIPLEKLSLDNFKELKFILRNKDIINKERAVQVYSLSDFLFEIPDKTLKSIVNDKIVVLGLFEGYKNKYNQQPDSYITPIGENTSGVMINVNAYLNLLTDSYLKSDQGLWTTLFLLILLSASALLWIVFRYSNKTFSKFLWLILFLAISILGTMYLSQIFWVYLNYRISFSLLIPFISVSWLVFWAFENYFLKQIE